MVKEDANMYYLKKHLDRNDLYDSIYSQIDEAIQYDLSQIGKHIDGIVAIIKEYEDMYEISIDAEVLIKPYLEDLL